MDIDIKYIENEISMLDINSDCNFISNIYIEQLKKYESQEKELIIKIEQLSLDFHSSIEKYKTCKENYLKENCKEITEKLLKCNIIDSTADDDEKLFHKIIFENTELNELKKHVLIFENKIINSIRLLNVLRDSIKKLNRKIR